MKIYTRCAVVASLTLGSIACGPDYDVVIEGGRVMDPESGFDAIANIGIVGGVIDIISAEPLSGAQVILADGLVVAPGFVDLHRHGHTEEGYRLQVRDGVTTGLELEIGTPNVMDWYAERDGGQLVNFGVAAGHIGARGRALGDSELGTGGTTVRLSTSESQRVEIARLLEEGIEAGGVGIGFGSAYTPGATMREIEQMFWVAAETGTAAFIHLRGGLAGLDSTLTAARNAGASLHVVHANSSGGRDIIEFLDMIAAAAQSGQDVTTEAYPYAASQTNIAAALFDDWESWDDEDFERYQWVRTGERLTRETFEGYRAEGGSVIIHSRTAEMTRAAMTHPVTMIASDGGIGHPRAAGTFSRMLGRYVREDGSMELMDALARMTILPAARLEGWVPAMRNKGRIRIGADADITIFDPLTVIDQATYVDGSLPPIGIDYVIVNGVPVVMHGEIAAGVKPGRAIKSGAW